MTRRFKIWAAGLLLTALTLPAGMAQAQDVQSRTIKLAFLPTADHPIGLGAKRLADLVAEKSGGQITVKIYPGGVLGPDLQNYSAMQGGTLDFNISNASYLAGNVKEMAVFDFPFLFNTVEEVGCGRRRPGREEAPGQAAREGPGRPRLYRSGLPPLQHPAPAVAKAEDVAGLKMRVIPTPIYVEVMNALGANAVPMPYTEVYSALETGAVDGMTNTLVNIIDMKFYEVAKHVTLTNHMYNAQALIMSKKTWDKLTEAERRIVQEAGAEMARLPAQGFARPQHQGHGAAQGRGAWRWWSCRRRRSRLCARRCSPWSRSSRPCSARSWWRSCGPRSRRCAARELTQAP